MSTDEPESEGYTAEYVIGLWNQGGGGWSGAHLIAKRMNTIAKEAVARDRRARDEEVST